jgi:hypothetical protein
VCTQLLCTFHFQLVPLQSLQTTEHPSSCLRSISPALQSAHATRLPLAAPSAHRQPCDQHGHPVLRRHAFPRKSRKSSTSRSSSPLARLALPNRPLKRLSPQPRLRSLKSTNRLRSTSRPLSRLMARAPSYTPMSDVVLLRSLKETSTLRLAKLVVPRTTLCDGVTRATGVTMAVLPTFNHTLSSSLQPSDLLSHSAYLALDSRHLFDRFSESCNALKSLQPLLSIPESPP